MGFERARAGRRVVEKATRDRVNHSFAATPRSVPSLLPLTRHSGDMLLQSDVDGVGMCVRQAPGRKVLTVAMFLPAAERTGLCLAHVTHICGYACGYAPDIWLLGALALRYDYTDTIQSC